MNNKNNKTKDQRPTKTNMTWKEYTKLHKCVIKWVAVRPSLNKNLLADKK